MTTSPTVTGNSQSTASACGRYATARAADPGGPPRTDKVPDVGRMRPAISLSSVLLPAPLGPMTARSEPWRTVSDTSSRAIRRPYAADTWSTTTDEPAAGGPTAMTSPAVATLTGPSRQGRHDLVDVPAHQAEIAVGRRRAEGIVVERRDDLRDPGFLGERLGQLRAELRLAEHGFDAGRLDLVDEGGEVRRRRLLSDVREDDPDELEPEVAGEVRERVMERHELPICLRDGRDLRLELGVEAVECRAVCRCVCIVRRLAGRIDLAELRRDLRDVVLLHEAGVEPEVGVGLTVHGNGGDAIAEDELRCLPAGAGGEEPVEEVVQADPVRDDEFRVAELAGVVGFRLIVFRPDTGRDDRCRDDAAPTDVLDDVGEDGRRGHDLDGIGRRGR